MKKYLIDTDILIDALRGNEEAIRFLNTHQTDELAISVITLSVLHAGARTKKEEISLETFTSAFTVFPIDEKIARSAGTLKSTFGKSHGAGLADCMIAATALNFSSTVVTLNKKHYPSEIDVLTPYRKP